MCNAIHTNKVSVHVLTTHVGDEIRHKFFVVVGGANKRKKHEKNGVPTKPPGRIELPTFRLRSECSTV